MIYLRTGLPGASKSLNSIIELVESHDPERQYFYTNVKLFMLDYEVASSFSGWFYGWYFPRLKNGRAKKAIIKIMRRVHDEDEFLQLSDLPWLESLFTEHDHFSTWLYWVRKVYSPKQRERLEEFLSNASGTDCYNFEHVKQFNLHFTRFDDGKLWFKLPKRSVIWIDECQKFFPPRGLNSKVPPCVSEFEEHRHKGWDIHLVTQDAKLMDVNVRRLVGRHIHYFNPFGGNRVTRYQSPKAFDIDNWHEKTACEKKIINRNKVFYGIYWSAEIHTHKFRLPKFVPIFIGLILFLIMMAYFLYQTLFSSEEVVEAQNATEVTAAPTTKSGTTEKLITVNEVISSHMANMIKDVYIDGSVTTHKGEFKRFDYSFSNSVSKVVFDPESIGLDVYGISPCLAKLKYDNIELVLTCNPFYQRPEPKEERIVSSGRERNLNQSI